MLSKAICASYASGELVSHFRFTQAKKKKKLGHLPTLTNVHFIRVHLNFMHAHKNFFYLYFRESH